MILSPERCRKPESSEDSLRRLVHRHPLVAYVLLAYGLSWAAWAPLLLRGSRVAEGGSTTQVPGLLGPALAALIVVGSTEGRAGVYRLLRRAAWVPASPVRLVVYGLSPVGFLALALAVSRVMGQATPPVRQFALYPGVPVLPLPIVALVVLVINGYGEEIGWRGFALARFQERFGPIMGTVFLGVTWAGWHAPLFRVVEAYRTMGPATVVFGSASESWPAPSCWPE
jgi:membrane protease YdiL (CAAX protease family)